MYWRRGCLDNRLGSNYAIGGSVVARGVTPNLALYFGGEGNLPTFLARHTIFSIVVDPCAAVLIIVAMILMCTGVKESSLAQTIVTFVNVCALVFVIVAGGYLAYKHGWIGYELPNGYFPFGINGVLGGSATVFFSYFGFDSVTATAEEVKNPKRDLPLGIGISLSLSCILYMVISIVIIGLVPYYDLDEDTPISSAFSQYGIKWAALIITTGAVMALLATLMGSLLPQARILLAMARDGLLPSYFSDINTRTKVPVKGTAATGILATALAFCMEVSDLAGMVSVGTLLAFTAVAILVLVIRYIPPNELSLIASAGESSSAIGGHAHNIQGLEEEIVKGVLLFTSSASAESLPSPFRFIMCGIGGAIFLVGTIGLAFIGQDGATEEFGHSGGFLCPFVPYLPAASILLNTYLLINLGADTWIRVSVWLIIGALVYLFYGPTHSLLLDASYAPITRAEDISNFL